MKAIGYLLSLIGIIGLAINALPTIKAKIPQISSLDNQTLIIISGIILIMGVIIIAKHVRSKEVPIYKDNKIVGYRRV